MSCEVGGVHTCHCWYSSLVHYITLGSSFIQLGTQGGGGRTEDGGGHLAASCTGIGGCPFHEDGVASNN